MLPSIVQIRKIPTPWSGKGAITSKPVPLSSCCGRCKVAFYCSKEHQQAHFPTHKFACTALSRNVKTLQREEQKLRAHPGDIDTPPNAFSTACGQFWGYTGTRDYMRARADVVDALGGINTYEAVQAQLAHVAEMLKLSHNDNIGMRLWIPPLLLRRNRDQDCYDFIAWWKRNDDQDFSKWKGLDAGPPAGTHVTPFGSFEYLAEVLPELGHLSIVVLVKVKMLLDLCMLQRRRDPSVLDKLNAPAHVLDAILPFTPRSPIVTEDASLMSFDKYLPVLHLLELRVYTMFSIVQSLNRHFWRMRLNPGNALRDQPDLYRQGSVEEAKMTLAYTYSAWVETPGAIEYVK